MNRLVLIGNGFDLAHGLPTSYKDFINWYLEKRISEFKGLQKTISEDCLCAFEDKQGRMWNFNALNGITLTYGYNVHNFISGLEVYRYLKQHPQDYNIIPSDLFGRIIKNIDTKGWVDIEQDYYDLLKFNALDDEINEEAKYSKIEELNDQLDYLKKRLIAYLSEVGKQQIHLRKSIEKAIYAPFRPLDFSISGQTKLREYAEHWLKLPDDNQLKILMDAYGKNYFALGSNTDYFKQKHTNISEIPLQDFYDEYLLPQQIMLLNFNYTPTALKYLKEDKYNGIFVNNYIHGEIEDPNSVIFGYGDEIDKDYYKLKELNNNECLNNVKSILYQNAPNYKDFLRFIESAPFQVLIMGHSCGISDRTLLNTIFEHENCVSIKPYYHQKNDGTNDYIKIVQNISRNFTDMKLMRDRVVDRTQCEPLVNE